MKPWFKKLSNIAQGMINAMTQSEQALYEVRYGICAGVTPGFPKCHYYNETLHLCTGCRCPIQTKGRVPKERCPIGKW